MPNSIQAIYILIVLLPGFLVVTIVELLTGMRAKENHRFIVYSLGLSVAVYVVHVFLSKELSLPDINEVLKSLISDEKGSSLQSFVLSMGPWSFLLFFFSYSICDSTISGYK